MSAFGFESVDLSKFAGQRVGVVLGGESAERDISLKTGQALAQALRDGGHEVATYDLPSELSRLVAQRPAVVVIAMHSGIGEDGSLQGFLEVLQLPYTGSGVLATALAMDKARAKAVMREAGCPLAPGLWLGPEALSVEAAQAAMTRQGLSLPVIMKPNDSGSSCGVHLVREDHELEPALAEARDLIARGQASSALIEAFIEGPEYSVGFFDDACLGVIRITPAQGLYDYQAKYLSGTTRYEPIGGALGERIAAIAAQAWRALGCRGVGRVDVLGHEDRLVVLEANTVPGMTATSIVPKLAASHGIDFVRFAALMVATATTDAQARLSGLRG